MRIYIFVLDSAPKQRSSCRPSHCGMLTICCTISHPTCSAIRKLIQGSACSAGVARFGFDEKTFTPYNEALASLAGILGHFDCCGLRVLELLERDWEVYYFPARGIFVNDNIGRCPFDRPWIHCPGI